ncbi:rod shape-determining protein MreC [Candidatus Palauibacter sp.]|uniref:rod shape-determining protein MreC n=1 Tax=Candidatus Palauibacter sp. TaxID=3101350 RepID=UPI003AF28D9C
MTYPGVQPPGRGTLELTTLLLVLILGGIAASLSRERQSQIESAVRATVLYPFLALHRAAAERGQIERHNRELLVERESLTELVMRTRAQAARAVGLRAAEVLPPLLVGSATPAVVYPGRPYVGNPDVFMLDGPDFSGREFPIGVFTGTGLVGVARAPHGRGASGEFWSHADFRVTVMAEDGGTSGFVRSIRAESRQPVLLLEGAPFQADIPVGTLVVTTGIGGVYPPGIPVGWIREPSTPEAGWMKRYVVEPAVRPPEVRDVFVWERPDLSVGVEADSVSVPADSGSVGR